MENIEKVIKEVMAVKGEVRGLILKQDLEYVLKKMGQNGLQQVEERLKLWGHPIKYKEIKNTDFYPAGLRALTLLASKDVFGWEDQEIKNLCAYHLKAPLAMRLFMKYFASLDRVLEKSSVMWQDYWTIGNLKVLKFDKKEKYIILELKEFDLHPIFCCCLGGYLREISAFVTRSSDATCEEIKCVFKGDDSHRFLIKW